MKTLILQNILSSNNVHTINSLIELEGLRKKDVKVFFCSATEANRRWTLHERPNFSYEILEQKNIKIQGKDLFTYFINSSILQVLKKENPERIIVGGWDQFAYQIAVIWGKLQGKRVTIWSGSTKNEPSWRRIVSTPLVRLLVWCASDFIAYGKRAKEYLISLGAGNKKIKILLNDVNAAYFARQARKYRHLKKKIKKKYGIFPTRNFIFVGQLIERKGINNLLEAYGNLMERGCKWGLVIVGYGYLEEEVERRVKARGLSGVKVIQAIEQYDLPQIYVTCDCLVLPSHEEVWGLVVNEALACGLDAIVSDVCGCVDDLKAKIKIFKTGNVKSLEQKMLQISKGK